MTAGWKAYTDETIFHMQMPCLHVPTLFLSICQLSHTCKAKKEIKRTHESGTHEQKY